MPNKEYLWASGICSDTTVVPKCVKWEYQCTQAAAPNLPWTHTLKNRRNTWLLVVVSLQSAACVSWQWSSLWKHLGCFCGWMASLFLHSSVVWTLLRSPWMIITQAVWTFCCLTQNACWACNLLVWVHVCAETLTVIGLTPTLVPFEIAEATICQSFWLGGGGTIMLAPAEGFVFRNYLKWVKKPQLVIVRWMVPPLWTGGPLCFSSSGGWEHLMDPNWTHIYCAEFNWSVTGVMTPQLEPLTGWLCLPFLESY